jgi:hypothetical protein
LPSPSGRSWAHASVAMRHATTKDRQTVAAVFIRLHHTMVARTAAVAGHARRWMTGSRSKNDEYRPPPILKADVDAVAARQMQPGGADDVCAFSWRALRGWLERRPRQSGLEARRSFDRSECRKRVRQPAKQIVAIHRSNAAVHRRQIIPSLVSVDRLHTQDGTPRRHFV